MDAVRGRFGPPGEQIGYALSGREEGPPLALFHGLAMSGAAFDFARPALERDFRVLAMDLLGHGDSDAPDDPAAYAPEPAIETAVGLWDELGFGPVLLCGHSLGGALALRLALDRPERLSGLVVMNSQSAAMPPERREQSRASLRQLAARVRTEGTEFIKQTSLYPAASKRLDPAAKELLERTFDALSREGVAGTAEGLIPEVSCYERHPELAVPMLLLVGEMDRAFVPNVGAFFARFPAERSRLQLVRDAGHNAHIDQPAVFAAALREFALELCLLDVGSSE